MLSRKLLILLLIVLFTVLQSTALNYIQILNNKPDLLLILIFFFSLNYGRIYGLTVGALCGLFSEVTSGLPVGAAILAYSLGGLILGQLSRLVYSALFAFREILPDRKDTLFSQRIFSQLGITFVFSLVIYFSFFLLLQTFNVNLSLFKAITAVVLPASFYTAIVSPFIFRFLKTVLAIS